jgi:FdhD protein
VTQRDASLETKTQTRVWRDGCESQREDHIAVEAAVAVVYNGVSHLVMMLTPNDLEDFALGFSLSEGILETAQELLDVDAQSGEQGLELHLTITSQRFAQLKARRRNLTGRTGCGLCGAESLAQAIRPLPRVPEAQAVAPEAVQKALGQLDQWQPLQLQTGAVHGAAWCTPQGDIRLLREDVGRHNALDKLLGAHCRGGYDRDGFVLVTSRASYEMVSKVAMLGFSQLVAVSAATSLAIEQANACGLTLVGFARPGRQVRYA